MIDLGKFTFDIIYQLLIGVIQQGTSYTALAFFEKRKIERRIEDATAEVIEPLLPFLTNEGIVPEQQRIIIETCVRELEPTTKSPNILFQGSLNGQKIFEDIYSKKSLPQQITEEGLRDIYSLVFPRIATLLCQIPATVKDWESQAWTENFRRFDEVTGQIKSLFNVVDKIAASPEKDSDELLSLIRTVLTQKILLELDLTGLRADKPVSGRLDDFFVHPEIKEIVKNSNSISIKNLKNRKNLDNPEKSLEYFLGQNRKCVITGSPGSGKSTWSRWLQREALRTRWVGIVVRVELRQLLIDNLPSIHELVREVVGKHHRENITADKVNSWINKKKILFLLDGFDEIRPSNRDDCIDWIKDLSVMAQSCPVILTSRPLTTNHINSLTSWWKQWIMEPFDDSRVTTYIEKWHTNTPLLSDNDRVIDAQGLASTWLHDTMIGPLTGNPLLLSTLLMAHHLDGKLPQGRSQLYKRYVDGMLGLWDHRRQVDSFHASLSWEEKRQVIRALALMLFNKEIDQIDETDLFNWLHNFLENHKIKYNATEVLATLRERTGLIVGPGIYSFSHKSIMEYLVAEAILQGDQRDEQGNRIDRFRLFEHRDDDRWNTIIFLWSGLAPIADVENFIEECIKGKAPELAYGILLDQYERFSAQTIRDMILYLNSQDLFHNWKHELYYGVRSGSNTKIRLPIKSVRLRSLTLRSSLLDLFEIIGHDDLIVPSDFINASSNIKDNVWIYFITRSKDLDLWQDLLRNPRPHTDSKEWYFLILSWRLHFYSFTNSSEPLTDLIEAFKKSCPQFIGLIPIVLCSIIIDPPRFHIEDPDKNYIDRFHNIQKAFLITDINNVDEEFLIDTISWEGSLISENNNYDLINGCKTHVNKLLSATLIPEELGNDILKYLHLLEDKRNGLLQSK